MTIGVGICWDSRRFFRNWVGRYTKWGPLSAGGRPDQVQNFPVASVSKRYGRPIRNQGLGFRLEGEGRSARFSHHGGNTGYRCFLIAYKDLGQGAVVMTNSDNGFELVQEIIRSIAKEYSWPDYPFDFKQ